MLLFVDIYLNVVMVPSTSLNLEHGTDLAHIPSKPLASMVAQLTKNDLFQCPIEISEFARSLVASKLQLRFLDPDNKGLEAQCAAFSDAFETAIEVWFASIISDPRGAAEDNGANLINKWQAGFEKIKELDIRHAVDAMRPIPHWTRDSKWPAKTSEAVAYVRYSLVVFPSLEVVSLMSQEVNKAVLKAG